MTVPTFVAQFDNGEVTRMSVATALDELDFARGVRISHAAMALRASHRPELHSDSKIVAAWFELGGVKLADMPVAASKGAGRGKGASPQKKPKGGGDEGQEELPLPGGPT
jgi:hypothetical protein